MQDLKFVHQHGSLSKHGKHVYAIGNVCDTLIEKLDMTSLSQWERVSSPKETRRASATHKGKKTLQGIRTFI